MREDDADFTEFVQAHSAALLRTAYYLTSDRGLAEDLLQATLAKTYLRWSRIESGAASYAYARKVMVHIASSWWRRMAWRAERPRDDVPELSQPADTEAVEERARVLAGVRRLPAKQRAVIALRFLEDLSEAETARLLGCSPGTLKSHTSRALKRLRTELADDPNALELVEEGR